MRLLYDLNEMLTRGITTPRRWGQLEVTKPLRTRDKSFRLTVFEPGIRRGERRLLWLDSNAPYAALVIGLPTVLLTHAVIPWPVTALVTIGALLVVAVLRRSAAALRLAIPCAHVTFVGVDIESDPSTSARMLAESVSALVALDQQRREKTITDDEYTAQWWRVYERVAAHSPLSA